jgi:tetratricopeptide (TPR) repeat protein
MKRERLAKFFMLLFLCAVMIFLAVLLIGQHLEGRRTQESSLMRELFLQQSYNAVIQEHEKLPEELQLSVTGLYYTGLSHYALGQYTDAVRQFELLRVLYPGQSSPYILEITGTAYRHLGSFEKAARMLERSIESGRDTDSVYLHLIYCYRQLGEFDHMIDLLASYSPDDVKILFWAVDSLTEAGMGSRALSVLQQAHEETPLDLRITERLALMLQKNGRLSEAEALLDAALDSSEVGDAERSGLLLRLGDIYYYQGHLLEARNAWKEALRLDPAHTDARERLK